MKTGTVILAAGLGKRMHSALPKVIHPLLGKPLLTYAIESAQAVSEIKPIVIVGYEKEKVVNAVKEDVTFVSQDEQLGTAHAVMMAEPFLNGKADLVVITSADMPLVSKKTLEKLVAVQKEEHGVMTLISIKGDESRGFGRVLRDKNGNAAAIIEEKVANEEQLRIKEYNAGIYCIKADWLWDALKKVKKSPVGEYYLTDLLELAVREKQIATVVPLEDEEEAIGINNRIHLAEVEKIIRRRINEQFMLSCVTMLDP